LGGKGANLAEMSAIGLSVPPGFTITTEICDRFCNAWNSEIPSELWQQIVSSLASVETEMESQFGSSTNPLLLSVRSGAAISMPGMVSKKDVKKEGRWGQGTTFFCVVCVLTF
jgi:pyruvate,orthophosphate dikinase